LIVAIQTKKQPLLHRFIYALGIRHIGSQTATDLADHFRKLEKLASTEIDELSEIEGIGSVVAEAIVEWFSEPRNQKLLKKFRNQAVWPNEVQQTGGKLNGKRFVVTGSLEQMGRDEAAERIRSLGGTFQSSIAKDTDYLVVGANVGASKLAKANKLGTKQLNEDDFLKML
jgi:DNA ligase (NAD+)